MAVRSIDLSTGEETTREFTPEEEAAWNSSPTPTKDQRIAALLAVRGLASFNGLTTGNFRQFLVAQRPF